MTQLDAASSDMELSPIKTPEELVVKPLKEQIKDKTPEELALLKDQLSGVSEHWDSDSQDQVDVEVESKQMLTISLLNPTDNYKRCRPFVDNSVQTTTQTATSSAQIATDLTATPTSEQTEPNQTAPSSSQAEVKPPDSSSPEEFKDSVSKSCESETSGDEFNTRPSRSSKFDDSYFPSGHKHQPKKPTNNET